jgi:DNA-binding phage protein
MAVETLEYLSAAKRFIRAAGRRVAEADEIELGELMTLHDVVDEALLTAVRGLRARGQSWAYIASATGVTRQAAFKRWGSQV